MPRKPHPVDAYVSAFTALTPENVEELYDLVAEDVSLAIPLMSFMAKLAFGRFSIICMKPAPTRNSPSVMSPIQKAQAIFAGI